MRPVIEIENLAKRYRIGAGERTSDTLIGMMLKTLQRPLRNLRRLRKLTQFTDEEESDVIWALQDLSLAVEQGEVVGIIGRNGAGKSTLLKILSRITRPTAGRIEIEGRVSTLLEVGTGFHPELTGEENVYLNGTILGMTKGEIDHKFDEIIQFAGVEKFVNTPIKRYSTGMRARLAFAVAAFLEPEILLVDEVLSVGDASFRAKSYARMQKLARGGRTVLFVSHNMEAIRSFCTRALFLEKGRLEMDGEPIAVVNYYLERLKQQVQPELVPDPGQNATKDSRAVSLNRIVIQDEDGVPRTEFGQTDGLDVAIDYTVHKRWDDFLLRLRIFAEDGTNVITTSEEAITHRAPGRYTSVCRIPAGLLNHGHYDIHMWAQHGGSYTMFVKRRHLFFFIRHHADLNSHRVNIVPGILDPKSVGWQVSRRDGRQKAESVRREFGR